MTEFYNNDRENADFRADSADISENTESRIGKPEVYQEPTKSEKNEAQANLTEKISERIGRMKTDLAKMQEGLQLTKTYESNQNQAQLKEQTLVKLVRDQLDNGADNITQQESLQKEIDNHRADADSAREKLYANLPDGQRSTIELTTKIAQLEQDIEKEEDILQANK